MRYSQVLLSIVVGFATASIAEEPRTSIGILTCSSVKSVIEEPGNLACGFKPLASGAEEKYIGVVRGVDLGATGKQVLVWVVIGPANVKVAAGFLAQRYVKAKVVAGQPPVLIGEKNPMIALQFETDGEQTNNVITEVELKLSGTSA
jgi:hypothetical protein